MKSSYDPLPKETEEIASRIIDAAIAVHRILGPGLLERVYEVCLCHELVKRGLSVQRQVNVPIVYDGLSFEESYRIDILVEDQIIVELKAAENYNPVWKAQVLSYLKVTGERLGLLIYFNVPLLKDGVQRVIL
ncbi:MAG: GxxExxY protein [Candidatus Cloacimonetes bacterium]|nr:GxxExxY protein [Candidatus Cloacimonadota bacterium]